jgi:murein DD-endopeptidase MepM/ murein hydrolase activator NlpD
MSLAPADRDRHPVRGARGVLGAAWLLAAVLGLALVLPLAIPALAMPALALPASAAEVTAGPWQWPLEPQPRVVRAFEAPAGPFAAGHRGVDLAGLVGQQVLAAGEGVVAFAGMVAGRGVVSVQHPGGLRTTYEPVAAVLGAGDAVHGGTVLATLSAAPGHCLPGTCLHWGLRRGEVYLDPLSLVGLVSAARVRLLPVWTDRGPLLARERRGGDRRVRAARAGPPRAVGSRRGRCRRGRRPG